MDRAGGGKDSGVGIVRAARQAEGWVTSNKMAHVDANSIDASHPLLDSDPIVESKFIRLVVAWEVAAKGVARNRTRF